MIHETDILFLGASERSLACDFATPNKIWEDDTDLGIWSWARHGDTVIMSDGMMHLDVTGKKSSFSLKKGPE